MQTVDLLQLRIPLEEAATRLRLGVVENVCVDESSALSVRTREKVTADVRTHRLHALAHCSTPARTKWRRPLVASASAREAHRDAVRRRRDERGSRELQ